MSYAMIWGSAVTNALGGVGLAACPRAEGALRAAGRPGGLPHRSAGPTGKTRGRVLEAVSPTREFPRFGGRVLTSCFLLRNYPAERSLYNGEHANSAGFGIGDAGGILGRVSAARSGAGAEGPRGNCGARAIRDHRATARATHQGRTVESAGALSEHVARRLSIRPESLRQPDLSGAVSRPCELLECTS